MTRRFSSNLTLLVVGVVTSASLSVCHAEYMYFDQNTDTIAISGETTLATSATFEAIVLLTASAEGSVYREQGNASEHKSLVLSGSILKAFTKVAASDPGGFSVAASIPLNVFHHIAFVHIQNGINTEKRLYLDGVLIGSQSLTLAEIDINDATSAIHPPAIGASQINTSNESVPGFVGLLDSVRISNIARYVGSSFPAPTEDLSADPNTLLLYNFDAAEVSGSTVADLSGNGHTGTFGTGFSGATAPVIVPGPTPGDLNGDGWVDIFDVGIVSDHWEETGAAGIPGDANFDGSVDIFDVGTISEHWNPNSGASVPEPSTMVLALVAILSTLVAQWARIGSPWRHGAVVAC